MMGMTSAEFKKARRRLGLSVYEMADVLGVKPNHIRRMETTTNSARARPVMPITERLMIAYLDGYRPADWPQWRKNDGESGS